MKPVSHLLYSNPWNIIITIIYHQVRVWCTIMHDTIRSCTTVTHSQQSHDENVDVGQYPWIEELENSSSNNGFSPSYPLNRAAQSLSKHSLHYNHCLTLYPLYKPCITIWYTHYNHYWHCYHSLLLIMPNVRQVICLSTCITLLVLWYFYGFVCFFGLIIFTLLLLYSYTSLTLPLLYSLLIIVRYLVSRC